MPKRNFQKDRLKVQLLEDQWFKARNTLAAIEVVMFCYNYSWFKKLLWIFFLANGLNVSNIETVAISNCFSKTFFQVFYWVETSTGRKLTSQSEVSSFASCSQSLEAKREHASRSKVRIYQWCCKRVLEWAYGQLHKLLQQLYMLIVSKCVTSKDFT